jgi:fatty-acyl-CoA synthase
MYPVDFFFRTAQRSPDRVAVETDETQLTYRQLALEVTAAAGYLCELDPAQGSRVGICAYNSLDHLVAWLAVLAAGKVWVPLYPANGSEELCRGVGWVGASLVLAAGSEVDRFSATRASVLDLAAFRREANARQLRPSPHHASLGATQAIKFTGGTTGRPKGVQQPYRAWNTNIVTQIFCYRLDADTRYLTSAPMTHGTSTYILPTLAVGGTLVVTDRPRPEAVLRQLAERRITTLFVPPSMIYSMLEQARGQPPACPSLRHLIYGAAPMRRDAIEEVLALFGPVLHSTYGQTEAPQIATHIGPEDFADPTLRDSVGRPTLLTSVVIRTDEGVATAAAGIEGEILIAGDLLMSGYWNDPARTAEALKDGWLHTGDIGVFDTRGYLTIKGRLKEMIISGGFNVYPSDVEPTLGAHPAIKDAAVFGVPDRKWGEAVHAVVALNAGHAVTPEELMAHVRERLGPVKTPKAIRVWSDVPRNPFGKINRQQLLERYLDEENAP